MQQYCIAALPSGSQMSHSCVGWVSQLNRKTRAVSGTTKTAHKLNKDEIHDTSILSIFLFPPLQFAELLQHTVCQWRPVLQIPNAEVSASCWSEYSPVDMSDWWTSLALYQEWLILSGGRSETYLSVTSGRIYIL